LRQPDCSRNGLQKERPDNPRAQVDAPTTWHLAGPSPELESNLAFLQKRGASALPDFCQPWFNLNEFVYVLESRMTASFRAQQWYRRPSPLLAAGF